MASSGSAVDETISSGIGFRIRSKEDLQRLMVQLKKQEAVLKAAQKRVKAKEARLADAQRKLKKRNDFLDAWEVSLKSKEAETVDERRELENLKQSLRKIGQELLELSDKADSVFEGLPYKEDVFDDFVEEDVTDGKKSFLGFLKGKPKKEKACLPRSLGSSRKAPSVVKKDVATHGRKTLRDTLKEKRDELKTSSIEAAGLAELDELLQDEVFACPTCNAEVSATDDVCPGCGAEISWGA